MRRLLMALALALVPVVASAQVYKCTGADGKIAFSDRPCGGSDSQEALAIKPSPTASAGRDWEAEEAKREETKRFRYVEVPAIERQAAELIASGDPQKVALGKEMAWKAHQAKEAFDEMERVRKSRAEIEARYDRLRRY